MFIVYTNQSYNKITPLFYACVIVRFKVQMHNMIIVGIKKDIASL